MKMEKKPPAQRYKMESDPDQIRIIIAPFNNYRLFKVIVYLFLLFIALNFIFILIPIVIVFLTPFGSYLMSTFAGVLATMLLPVAIVAVVVFTLQKNQITVEIGGQGITVKNSYWFIKRETNYLSEKIKNIRLLRNGSWGAIAFDYETATVEICQSLSEEEGNQIISAIGEKFPQYKPEIEAGKAPQGGRKMSRIQALGASFLVICFIGGLGTLLVLDPDLQTKSIPGLVLVWVAALAVGVSFYLNSQKRSWRTTLVLQLGLTALTLAYSIQTIWKITSGWIWTLPIIGMFVLAWILPVLNSQMAEIIHDGLKKLGKKLTTAGVVLFSGLAFIGSVLPHEETLYKADRISMGILLAATAICGGQIMACELWNQRLREKQEKPSMQPD